MGHCQYTGHLALLHNEWLPGLKCGIGGFPGGPVVDSALSLQGAQVQSLVRELRSHMPHGAAKTKTKWNKQSIIGRPTGVADYTLIWKAHLWDKANMDITEILSFCFKLELSERFHKWHSFNVSNGATQLGMEKKDTRDQIASVVHRLTEQFLIH